MLLRVLQNDNALQKLFLLFFSKGSLSEDFLRRKFLNKIVCALLYNIRELTQKVIKHSQDTFKI